MNVSKYNQIYVCIHTHILVHTPYIAVPKPSRKKTKKLPASYLFDSLKRMDEYLILHGSLYSYTNVLNFSVARTCHTCARINSEKSGIVSTR